MSFVTCDERATPPNGPKHYRHPGCAAFGAGQRCSLGQYRRGYSRFAHASASAKIDRNATLPYFSDSLWQDSASGQAIHSGGTNFAEDGCMLIVLSLFGLSVASVGLLAFELWNAPEAFEDASGFHRVGHAAPVTKTRKSNPRVSPPEKDEAGINKEQPVPKR